MAEFDKLSRQRQRLEKENREAQEVLRKLAEELLYTQKVVSERQNRIGVLRHRQEDMADRAAVILGELAEEPGVEGGEAAIMDDNPLFWEDPQFDAVLFSDPSLPLPSWGLSGDPVTSDGDNAPLDIPGMFFFVFRYWVHC